MKHWLTILTTLCLPLHTLLAQQVEYRTDETCDCEQVFVDGIETTRADGLYGFSMADGTVIAEPQFRYVDRFNGDYCRVYLDEKQCGMIDRKGNQIVPCIYDDMTYPSEGRIWVVKDGLCGYTNLRGEVVIPIQYRNSSNFNEGLAVVFYDIDSFSLGCTFIDTLGRQVLPPVFQNARPFHDGFAAVRRYDRWGVIDRQGHEVLPCMYEKISIPEHGYFFAGNDDMAFFDYRMQPLTHFKYCAFEHISDGRILVKSGEKYGYIDRLGHEVIPPQFDQAFSFFSGYAHVAINGKHGIIDTTGRFVLPLEYDDNSPRVGKYSFRDGLALVERDGMHGFVDTTGTLVVPMLFDDAYPFSQGLAAVRHHGMWGYIDTKGDVYINFYFDIAAPFQYGRAEVYFNGVQRKMDLQGHCVKNCKGIISWR